MRQAAVAISIPALLYATAASSAPDPQFAQAVARSGLIFKGTVKKIGAATPSVPVEKRSAIVKVDEVLEAAPDGGDLAGQEVTVRLGERAAVREGAQAVFLTHAYLIGRSVGLVEVGEVPPRDGADLKREIAEVRQAQADAKLAALLAASPLVVAGIVESVEQPRGRQPLSLHDPMWTEANLRVESVGKGKAGDAVVVYFARSRDTTWAAAPKLKPGQQGVFILRDGSALKRFAIKAPVLLIADDVQPRTAVDKIRTLMKVGAR